MRTTYSLTHLSDQTLDHDLHAHAAGERISTAMLVAHIAEFDARKLYLPAAYPSMYAYCVENLRMSEDAACKRIRVGRAARQFPALFAFLADGRLHLSGAVKLSPHLSEENVHDLLAETTHQTLKEIEQLLALRFPRPDLPARIDVLAAPLTLDAQPASSELDDLSASRRMDDPVESSASRRMETPGRPPRVAPLAPERYALQVTIDQSTLDLLRQAQELLSHQLPANDVAGVLDRALRLLVGRLEKRKFGATTRPRRRESGASRHSRHIPAEVRRAVVARDGAQCTYVSASGRRCEERSRMEFDHVVEVARGGVATVEGVRLRCRAHNQYGAECTFGSEFMAAKREEARAKAAADARAKAERLDVTPWLRQLGFRADEARRAAQHCETMPDAALEARVRAALAFLAPRVRRAGGAQGGPPPLEKLMAPRADSPARA